MLLGTFAIIRSNANGYVRLSSEIIAIWSLFLAFPALQPRRSIFLGRHSLLARYSFSASNSSSLVRGSFGFCLFGRLPFFLFSSPFIPSSKYLRSHSQTVLDPLIPNCILVSLQDKMVRVHIVQYLVLLLCSPMYRYDWINPSVHVA